MKWFWWFGTGEVLNSCLYVYSSHDPTLGETRALVQELEERPCYSVEFIDDCLLLAGLESTSSLPPSLVLIDTEDKGGTPRQTTFRLSPQFKNFGVLFLFLEQGVHKPSTEESLTPFYPDPAQRIVLLRMQRALYNPAVSVGALLELKNRGRGEIEWDELRSHVVVPRLSLDEMGPIDPWVSGCRLFFICSTESGQDDQLRVYDFSMRGRAQYLSEEADQSVGGLRCLSPTPARAWIPRDWLLLPRSGHDSIVFPHVR